MNIFKSQRAKDRAERKAYRAMDALQSLCDDGLGCNTLDEAMSRVRNVINKIQEEQVSPKRKEAA